MKVKVKFLALVADVIGATDITLELSKPTKLGDLVKFLLDKYPVLKELEKKIPITILVNGIRVSENKVLSEGDEVALMPPASGG